MADIELITDGIAREIIEANKENNEKLINTLHDIDKTTILLAGKHKYANESIFQGSLENNPEDPEPILYEVKGKGVLLDAIIDIESRYSTYGKLEVLLDGQTALRAEKPLGEAARDDASWLDWMKFEESLVVKFYRGKEGITSTIKLHYVLL